jgi:hypothetical protein
MYEQRGGVMDFSAGGAFVVSQAECVPCAEIKRKDTQKEKKN